MSETQINSITETGKSHEALFDPRSIAIVTATFYPAWYEGDAKDPLSVDKLRGDLALQTFRSAQEQNFQIIVVDNGSSDALKKALERSNIYFELQKQKGGYSPARRQGLKQAEVLQEVKVILKQNLKKYIWSLTAYSSQVFQF